MNENKLEELEQLAQYFLAKANEISLLTLEPGSPTYNFQQIIIKGAAQYRLFLSAKEKIDGKE